MSSASCYLALDFGASGGRAVLGMLENGRLQLEEIHRFVNQPVQILDRLHWDIPRLLAETTTALAKCAARQPRLDGIGIDTWGVDFGLLSAGGELLALPRHYRDVRTRGMYTEAFRRVPRERIYARTGIQFLEFNSLYQLLAISLSDRRLLDAAARLLFMPDLFNYWLTGRQGSEHSIATTSQLYDVATGQWAGDLLREFNLPEEIMPPVVPAGTVVGPLLPRLAAEAGLAPTEVIATTAHDTASAVAAVPGKGDDWAYISAGTWTPLGVELPEPLRTPEALAGNFTNEGGVAGTVRFLKNVAGLWLVQESRRAWAKRGQSYSFDELARAAAAAPAFVGLVDPDDASFLDPGDMPKRIQDYCAARGRSVPQSPGEIIRCALEGNALKYRLTIRQTEQVTGRSIKVIHLVGGGAHNELLCQLTADATGRPVVAGPVEATATGNVMVQALARGHVSSLREIREIISRSVDLRHYDPHPSPAWEEAERRLCEGR